MNKYKTIAEAILVLGLVILGGVELTRDKAMYCESRSIALNCERTTATRCYYADTYKVCKEGWKPFSDIVAEELEMDVIKVSANGGISTCQLNDGFANSYTRCVKENGEHNYLGELI